MTKIDAQVNQLPSWIGVPIGFVYFFEKYLRYIVLGLRPLDNG